MVIANLQKKLKEARKLVSAAIRDIGKPELAQLVAHLSACQRVLDEIKEKTDD